jgi:chaperonin GroES
MAFPIQPLQNFVVIKPGAKEEMRGGIVIPDTAQEKASEGKIVAVGPGRLSRDPKSGEFIRETFDVAVGDYVIYPKFGGTEIKVEGEEMVLLPENQILAKKIK